MWTIKGTVYIFRKLRFLETIGSSALAATLFRLFSFRLSHSEYIQPFQFYFVKITVRGMGIYRSKRIHIPN